MQERARRTRERILDAAAVEFVTHGLEGARLQVVADRVGMTKGAVYGHFASKQAVAAALEAYGAQMLSALRPDSAAADPVEELRRLVTELGTRLRSDIRLRTALRLRASRPAPHPPTVLSELLECTGDTVHAAQKQGTVDTDHSPHLIAGFLLTLTCVGADAVAPEELHPSSSDTHETAEVALRLLGQITYLHEGFN